MSYSDFHKNLTKDLAADTWLETDERADGWQTPPDKSSCLLRKELLIINTDVDHNVRRSYSTVVNICTICFSIKRSLTIGCYIRRNKQPDTIKGGVFDS